MIKASDALVRQIRSLLRSGVALKLLPPSHNIVKYAFGGGGLRHLTQLVSPSGELVGIDWCRPILAFSASYVIFLQRPEDDFDRLSFVNAPLYK